MIRGLRTKCSLSGELLTWLMRMRFWNCYGQWKGDLQCTLYWNEDCCKMKGGKHVCEIWITSTSGNWCYYFGS